MGCLYITKTNVFSKVVSKYPNATIKDLKSAIKSIEGKKQFTLRVKNANLMEAAWLFSSCIEFMDYGYANNVELTTVEKSRELNDGVNIVFTVILAAKIVWDSYKNIKEIHSFDDDVCYLILKLRRRIIGYKTHRKQARLQAWINEEEVN